MMTCRLLCALLVLALCFCRPSVCAEEAPTAKELNKTDVSASTPPSNPLATTTGKSGLSGSGSGLDKGKNSLGKAGTTGPEPQPGDAPDTVQGEDKSMTGRPDGSRPTADQTNEKAKDHAETTTTTTMAPTTTTTTAPEAPSTTTTTEAPTTTTTRAASRLRRIDGSLSSSAWVCAPLLLAASALAYTTLG
ncbi:putative mucin TcMUCII [Trypanosoma cruzi]|uniref:Mucin TcMUCII, putative n=2 Tax=Trypanosoma cruzi TaxID=5693 RepID=Q4E4Y2_TRYCC|nr:mucin TcMUCII, putative [Trypanosoma cruzi]EAN99845.1 mucin TcMUCII, putative [Trypanosoma cruzi]PWV21333.1 putative mucin TcMUCII [Trypanosoma cruzi]|eukprot:XP_821696.1 mucin TcMUCII [Trypanosoma cruzi strain CL Brener]